MTNIERLARLIVKLGDADKVMQALPAILQQDAPLEALEEGVRA